MASSSSTDFLRFSAYSMKDLITRKLSEDGAFSDQIYEGSNLAILIDIVSYIYQCLVYQLNSAAAESMFKDTQLYENMVRLVKFLDYNPRGCTPAVLNVSVRIDDSSNIPSNTVILPFSYIDSGLTDDSGKKIYFSLGEEGQNLEQSTADTLPLSLENGKWKLYNEIFTASGVEYETFTLTNLGSDSDDSRYVSNNILVYVYNESDNKYVKWNFDRNGIFITSKRYSDNGEQKYFSLYGNNTDDDRVYSISLNESHRYEIRFGDGNIGKKLQVGDKIYVFYLDTNGPAGQVDVSTIDFSSKKFTVNDDVKNLSPEFRKTIYENFDDNAQNMKNIEDYYTVFYNVETSLSVTSFIPEDSVDDIRENAPNWFKTGYRLITKHDYEYFIKNSADVKNSLKIGDIIDVKCMNNTDMVAKFYKWLYLMGLKRVSPNGRYYFENDFFTRTGYSYVDPSDTNNIYLWIKSKGLMDADTMKNCTSLLNGNLLNYIKIMTTEVQVMSPVTVNFDICAAPADYAKQNYLSGQQDVQFDVNADTYIEITLDDNQTYTGNNIQYTIYGIIVNAFNQNYIKLGQNIDPTAITAQIYQINGISRVRTVWNQPGTDFVKTLDGLSFASWSDSSVLDEYEDITVGNGIRHIEDFQYPSFIGENTLLSRIRIIKKQLVTVNSIKF